VGARSAEKKPIGNRSVTVRSSSEVTAGKRVQLAQALLKQKFALESLPVKTRKRKSQTWRKSKRNADGTVCEESGRICRPRQKPRRTQRPTLKAM